MLVGKHLDILLAEPDSAEAEELVLPLSEWGFPVTHVSGGYDAYSRLSTLQQPTLALISMNLPEMMALEILHKMRGTVARSRFSAILLTGDTRSDTVRQALDAGADDLLLKPCDDFELRVRLSVAERILALSSELAGPQAVAGYYATHDALTGIWNRETFLNMFFRETDRIQRSRESLALMLLDLEGLDAVKSEHGIFAADRVLQQVVERLQRFLRSYDMLGRFGGEEFLIALPGLRVQDTEKLVERMRRSIFSKPFRVQQSEIRLYANFGVVQSKGRSPLVVLRDAERELALARIEQRPLVHSAGSKTILSLRPQEEKANRTSPGSKRVQ
jgi:diguanylate cyclase (GGDEF)-like protein